MRFFRAKSPYLYGSVTVVALLLVGWLVGRVMATSDNTYMRILLLQDVVSQVSMRYVDYIPPEKLYRRAADGLLKNLDPYTELIPAADFKRFQEIQVRSEYVGIGISISKVENEIVVMSIYGGSSAWRQGVQPGDRLVKVNGQSTWGWTTEQASNHLLGPEGSSVEITLARAGLDEPATLILTRQPVVVPSVTRNFMLPDSTGYIRLSSFTERSLEELRKHLLELKSAGMKSLVLDLRDNSGGLTDPAVAIADLFLPKRGVIVSMRGRNEQDSKSFFSTGKPVLPAEFPLAVLINEFTASSSEILAGALQDHDRAVVLGQNSFGKGLVQTTFPLSSGDVLKITTARYYTPSGRNIQRINYTPRKEWAELEEEEEEAPADSAKPAPKKETFRTDMGREVTGGGGIVPDVRVELPPAAYDPLIARIFSHSFDFAVAYKSLHPGLDRNFKADETVFKAFVTYLKSKQVNADQGRLDELKDYITTNLLTFQIAQVTWDENTAYRLVAMHDVQLGKARELISGGAAQSQIMKRLMEEKTK